MSANTAGPALTGHGPWFDRVAMLLIGLVIVCAALLPAVTANAGGTFTIRGDVTSGGRSLAFFPVGFWTPTNGVTKQTRTDANGGFTLDVSDTIDGFAFAGTAPDAQQAIISVDGRQYVRGIIGARVATPVSTPVYQGWGMATGHSLAGGAAALHFLLQQPGRLAGTSPIRGTALRAIQVRRLNGSVVQTLKADRRGRFASTPLAPGDYALAVLPAAPMLPSVVRVTVAGGRTTAVTAPAPVLGATISGPITADGTAVPAGVPVLLEQSGVVVASTTSTSGGQYRFTGVSAGDYTVEAARYADIGQAGAVTGTPSAPVVVPGVAATPTSTALATPTPSPSATTAQQAALLPVQRTSDVALPGTSSVTVPASLGDVVLPIGLQAAGRIAGTVRGTDGAGVQVVAEDPGTGRILRSAAATAGGRYSIGGLQQGAQYLLAAVSQPSDPTLARSGTTSALATASTTGVDIALDAPAGTLSGTVTGATSGTVSAGDPLTLVRSSAVGPSGAYTVQGLVPGAYPVTVTQPGRLSAAPVGVQVTAGDAAQDLTQGPARSAYKGWFISGGAGVPRVVGTATSATGDRFSIGPDADRGHITESGLRPGTYTYDVDSFAGTVPATDGPWWYTAPTGSFTLSAGAPRDVGPVVLSIHAH